MSNHDEPVAWGHFGPLGWSFSHVQNEAFNRPLYTRPQPAAQWVGLTDEEVLEIGLELVKTCRFGGNPNIDFDYARAIEAKLREKNA